MLTLIELFTDFNSPWTWQFLKLGFSEKPSGTLFITCFQCLNYFIKIITNVFMKILIMFLKTQVESKDLESI